MKWVRLGGWSAPLLAFGVATTLGLVASVCLHRSVPTPPPPTVGVDPYDPYRQSTWEKQQVAREVLVGATTLLAAAAEVRGIDQRSPHFRWDLFRERRPEATDDERHCWEVVEWVQNLLADRPDEAERWARRLADQIERHRAEDTLRLPSAAPQPW